MGQLLAADVTAHITNADGEIDEVVGREPYLRRIEAMQLPAVRFSIELTQPPVAVGPDRALIMVEVAARKEDRSLRNYAAHLLRISDGKIAEWWMVDAKPAESARFWS